MGSFRFERSGARQIRLFAHVAQLAEHVLGKDEVISSILIMGSISESGCRFGIDWNRKRYSMVSRLYEQGSLSEKI